MATETTVRPALRVVAAGQSAASRSGGVQHRSGGRLLVVGLVALDALGLFAAFGLAYFVRFKTGLPLLDTPPYSGAFYSLIAYAAVPAWLALLALYRLYDPRYLFAGLQEYMRIGNACTAGVVALVMISFLDKNLVISRGWLVVSWLSAMVLLIGLRFAVRRVLWVARTRGLLTTATLIVGASDEGIALAEQLQADPGSGIRVLGFVDGDLPVGTTVLDGLSVVSTLAQVETFIRAYGVRELVVATTALTRAELLELYRTVGQDESVELRLSSGLFEILTTGVHVHEIACVPLMTPQRVRITGLDAILKCVVDYAAALAAVGVLAPVMLMLALLIRLDSPGPILHRRRVLGVSGRAFDAFKFRTMVQDADAVLARDAGLRAEFEGSYKLKHDPRITRIGQFLRTTSLDELPQLFNVLRGEMSLVGPRMIAPDEAARYGKWQLNLLTVKPGITGPWQVQGRGDLPYDQRVRLSMHYIRNHSVWLDLAILLRTIAIVLRRTGAY
jgi:exopolysaccharide biosynthesis polyprenyl glycosylphosphotransferase